MLCFVYILGRIFSELQRRRNALTDRIRIFENLQEFIVGNSVRIFAHRRLMLLPLVACGSNIFTVKSAIKVLCTGALSYLTDLF